MKKKIIILILATIIVGITVFLRIIFVCKGDVLGNLVYKSENLIIQQVQKGNRNLIILGTGYSVSVDDENKVVSHDPFMVLPSIEFQEETIMSIFYPFESEGLGKAGEELSNFINSVAGEYDSITLIGHSKCGVCFANAVKWMEHENINVITISAPFKGTPMADKQMMSEKLNGFEERIYTLVFSNHAVDKDTMPKSEFIQNADYSGLEKCTHVNIVSKCPRNSRRIIDVILMFFDKKGNIKGDGIVPKTSQQYVNYPNTVQKEIEATHATSFKIGIEIAKKIIQF